MVAAQIKPWFDSQKLGFLHWNQKPNASAGKSWVFSHSWSTLTFDWVWPIRFIIDPHYTPDLRNVTLCDVTPPLATWNPREQMCSVKISLLVVTFPSHASWVLTLKWSHQRIQTTRSHASHCHHCHYCNVDFVLFHNVISYNISLLSCILC
jgi:hypothetical protein